MFKLLFSISDIIKGGFLDYWRLLEDRKISKIHQKDFDNPTVTDDYNSISLNQLQSPLFILIIAIIVSLFIFISELLRLKQIFTKLFTRLRFFS